MIIDKIENYSLYPYGLAWEKAFAFLRTLTATSEDKKYPIDGDAIFAIVMSYETQTPQTAILESHEEYVDIQTVLVGAEGFECSFVDELEILTPYDPAIEAAFYKRPDGGRRVDVSPGIFVMLYPHDAHMPGLIIGSDPARVKKVVVKIKKELLSLKA